MITPDQITQAALDHQRLIVVEHLQPVIAKVDREYNEEINRAFAAGAQWMQEQYRWIPVTEKWPEPLQRVNFVVDAPGIYEHGKVYGGTYTGEPHHENPRWRNGFSTPGCGYRASHWMPSFEPPAINQPCT